MPGGFAEFAASYYQHQRNHAQFMAHAHASAHSFYDMQGYHYGGFLSEISAAFCPRQFLTEFRRDAANGASSDDADAAWQRPVGSCTHEFRSPTSLELPLPVLPRLPPPAASCPAAARLHDAQQ